MGTITLNLQIKEREAQEDEVIALGPPVSLWGLGEENRVLRDHLRGGEKQSSHKLERHSLHKTQEARF